MKHTLMAVALSVLATSAFSANPTQAPVLPNDFSADWKMVRENKCALPEGVVLNLRVYDHSAASRRIYLFEKNAVLINRIDRTTDNVLQTVIMTAFVRTPAGAWWQFDYTTERAEADDAIASVIDMSREEFLGCVEAQRQ